MSEMQRFTGFSSMNVSDGTFRVSWDAYHERMAIEFIKHGIHCSIYLTGDQGEAAGRELVRLAEDAKAKGQIPQASETPV